MPRMSSSNKCVVVDLLKELNELTDYDGDVRYFNHDDLEA